MADTTNVAFSAEYTSVSAWSGTLKITLTNNTGAPLTSPVQISFDMPLTVTPTSNTGLVIQSSGVATNHVVGTLSDTLLPIADGETITFNVGIGASGNLTADALPTAYYVNDVLAGEGGGETTDTTAPDAPTGLTSTGTTSSTIDLSWNAASDDVGTTGYIVSYTAAGGTEQTKRVTGTTTTLDGLSADTQYTISVEAYDAAGNVSTSSDSINVQTQVVPTDTTAPSVPENLRSTDTTQNSVALAWDASTDDDSGVNSYVVSYAAAGESAQTVTVSSTSTTITGLDPSTTYTFSVSAVDNAGNQSASSASLTTSTLGATDTTAPSVPGTPTVTNTTQSSVSLAWSASTDDTGVDHYVVAYTGADGTSSSVNVTSPSAAITGLSSSTSYTFSVSAVDAAGNQSASSSVVASTLAPPSTGGSSVPFQPYIDVTLFAKWSLTPAVLTTDFVNDCIAMGIKDFHLAFLTIGSDGTSAMWGDFQFDAIREIASIITAAGGEPIFAFGGLQGIDLSVSWSIEDLAALYIKAATDYGVKTIDLDYEVGGHFNIDVAFPAFIKAREAVPYLELCLTLPVLTTGLDATTGKGFDIIKSAGSYGLQPYINIMAMDYGESYTSGNLGQDAISAINGTKAQMQTVWGYSDAEAYSKIGVTVMYGHNDTDPEIFYLSDVDTVAAFAKEKNLYMVSAWAVTRDFAPGTWDANGNQHTNDKPSSTLIEGQEEYAFTKAFVKALS